MVEDSVRWREIIILITNITHHHHNNTGTLITRQCVISLRASVLLVSLLFWTTRAKRCMLSLRVWTTSSFKNSTRIKISTSTTWVEVKYLRSSIMLVMYVCLSLSQCCSLRRSNTNKQQPTTGRLHRRGFLRRKQGHSSGRSREMLGVLTE